MQKLTLFISCESDHPRLSSDCVKCLESTDMNCSMQKRPEVLYKQAKVALDSLQSTGKIGLLQSTHFTQNPGFSAYTQHWVLYTWDELIMSISQVLGKPLHEFEEDLSRSYLIWTLNLLNLNLDQGASTQILFELMKRLTYLGNTKSEFIPSIQNPVLSICREARILCAWTGHKIEMNHWNHFWAHLCMLHCRLMHVTFCLSMCLSAALDYKSCRTDFILKSRRLWSQPEEVGFCVCDR